MLVLIFFVVSVVVVVWGSTLAGALSTEKGEAVEAGVGVRIICESPGIAAKGNAKVPARLLGILAAKRLAKGAEGMVDEVVDEEEAEMDDDGFVLLSVVAEGDGVAVVLDVLVIVEAVVDVSKAAKGMVAPGWAETRKP